MASTVESTGVLVAAPSGQAGRSAATQRRLIAATVAILCDSGYARTTTVAVAQRAGVSRGAMLHHFPTRAELIVATAYDILATQDTHRREVLRSLPRGKVRFYAITDAMWATMQEPASMALIEIMLGGRSDPELSTRLPAIMREFNAKLLNCPMDVARELGIDDTPLLNAMSRLHLAAMRGMIIERLYWPDPERAGDEAFELLDWYKRLLMRRLDDPDFIDEAPAFDRPLRPQEN